MSIHGRDDSALCRKKSTISYVETISTFLVGICYTALDPAHARAAGGLQPNRFGGAATEFRGRTSTPVSPRILACHVVIFADIPGALRSRGGATAMASSPLLSAPKFEAD